MLPTKFVVYWRAKTNRIFDLVYLLVRNWECWRKRIKRLIRHVLINTAFLMTDDFVVIVRKGVEGLTIK